MSNKSILIIDESDSKLDIIIDKLSNNNQNDKLDTIIQLLDKNQNDKFDTIIQLLESYKNQIKKLELELEQKNSKIERLEKIKSDFKITTDTDIDNRLKQNLLIRQKKPFPFNHFLSYDYTLGKY